MEKNSLVYFALRFSVIAAVLLAIFYFSFPYYRALLRYSVSIFSKATDIQLSNNIFLTSMPYVSLSALVLATPKRTVKNKIKFLVLIFLLFFIIDFSFAVVQVLLQGTSIKQYHIVVMQDFFTISLPIVLWLIFSYKEILDVKLQN